MIFYENKLCLSLELSSSVILVIDSKTYFRLKRKINCKNFLISLLDTRSTENPEFSTADGKFSGAEVSYNETGCQEHFLINKLLDGPVPRHRRSLGARFTFDKVASALTRFCRFWVLMELILLLRNVMAFVV